MADLSGVVRKIGQVSEVLGSAADASSASADKMRNLRDAIQAFDDREIAELERRLAEDDS